MEYSRLYPFWELLTEKQKSYIEQYCYQETYQKGMLIHRSKDSCKGLITVLSGQLRTFLMSDEGREVTLFRVNGGEVCVLSTTSLMDSIEYDVLIEPTEKTEVLILPTDCLNHILADNPHMELFLYKTAAERFSEVMWTIQQILFQHIDQRVAAFLWDEYVRSKELTLCLTHDEIARNIGSAREVVSKALKYLAENGLIELKRGKIVIIDIEKLKSFL